MQAYADIASLDAYVSPVHRRMLAARENRAVARLEGTMVFADVSGFTPLTERLARMGNEGAEQLVDVIDGCFSALIADAHAAGGSLLKFGGDALLLWFEGDEHAARGCAAALAMRATLRRVGRVRAGVSTVVLRMSVGVHSGAHDFFLVGDLHRELVVAGPGATTAVAMESAAGTGQVLVSRGTAERLAPGYLGAAAGLGHLLARPPSYRRPAPEPRIPRVEDELILSCFSAPLRRHVIGRGAVPEHRSATVGFLQFVGLDDVLEASGSAAAAERVDGLVRQVQSAADRYGVCVLGTDVGQDGGKVILSSGAPEALGDDEERMLLTLRQVLDDDPPLATSAGVSRGDVFAGEVGPSYRRSYTLMGDRVNVAARLMASAPFGHVYASREVLERVRTSYRLTALAPLTLKGKRRPVAVLDVGSVTAATPLSGARRRLPLIGRQRELETIEEAIREAGRGAGSLLELIGESGSGKSRLLAEARRLGAGMRHIHTTCQAYTQDTPYSGTSDVLRQLLGLRVDTAEQELLERLRSELAHRKPAMAAWLPLLAIALGVSVPLTPEIEQLSPEVRQRKLQQTVFAFFEPELGVPTLVQIEHAQFIDSASADLLKGLARELYATSWLVLVTRREVAGGFVGEGLVPRIELGPLSESEAMALARAAPEAELLPPHVLELAVQRASGSPEFLLDLLVAAAAGNRDALPINVRAAAAARLDALEPDDRRLVCRAAVLGLGFEPERLGLVLSHDMSAPDPARWRRLEGVFAHDSNGQVRFRRPALQEAAYARLPFKLRRELHARVAQAIEHGAGGGDPAVLSQHWLYAGDPLRAHRYALLGAERARERFSHADAVRLYHRAIEAGRAAGLGAAPEGQGSLAAVWEELGDSLRCLGEPGPAARALSEARKLVTEGDVVTMARLCHRHAEVAERRESLTAAVRWLMRGLRYLEGSQSPEAVAWRARIRSYLGGIRNRQGRWAQAVAACREAIVEAESVNELRALARACYSLDWALVGLGRAEEAEHSARALHIYRSLGDPEHEMTVLNNLGMFAYFDGLWDDAKALYRRAGEASQRAGRPGDAAFTDCNVGEILSDQGHYEEAHEHLEHARRVWAATGDLQSVAYASLLLGRLAVRRGRLEEALPRLRDAMGNLRRYRLDGYANFAQALIAEAEAFAGDPQAAQSLLAALAPSAVLSEAMLRRINGVALARLGRRAAAVEELEASLAAARTLNADYDVAATIDLLDRLGAGSFALLRRRDEILARLRIEVLPEPDLGHSRQAARAV